MGRPVARSELLMQWNRRVSAWCRPSNILVLITSWHVPGCSAHSPLSHPFECANWTGGELSPVTKWRLLEGTSWKGIFANILCNPTGVHAGFKKCVSENNESADNDCLHRRMLEFALYKKLNIGAMCKLEAYCVHQNHNRLVRASLKNVPRKNHHQNHWIIAQWELC